MVFRQAKSRPAGTREPITAQGAALWVVLKAHACLQRASVICDVCRDVQLSQCYHGACVRLKSLSGGDTVIKGYVCCGGKGCVGDCSTAKRRG
jgi:hypothetical protein